MRKILICFLFYGNLFAGSDALVYNFANQIINASENSYLVSVTAKTYNTDVGIPQYKLDFLRNPTTRKFYEKKYPISTSIEPIFFFCKKHDSMVFLKKNRQIFSSYDKVSPVPISKKSLWIIIIETMYNDDGSLKLTDAEKSSFKDIENFLFINRETFFAIPIPQTENAICLKWEESDSFPLPQRIIKSDMTLVEDIKKLSSIFCDRKKYEFLDGISDIQKIIPSLQTDIGKQIAEKMIEILEKKIIETEFPKKIEGIKKSPKLNLEAVEKLYKPNKK